MVAREDVNAQSDARDSGSQSVPNSEWHSDRRVRSRRSRLVRFARHRQQIFQLNELRRGRPVTDRGAQRASLAVRKERDFTGNNNVLRISCDRILVDESETALPILGCKD